MEVKPLVMHDVEGVMALEPKKGIMLHRELIWATPSYFAFLR